MMISNEQNSTGTDDFDHLFGELELFVTGIESRINALTANLNEIRQKSQQHYPENLDPIRTESLVSSEIESDQQPLEPDEELDQEDPFNRLEAIKQKIAQQIDQSQDTLDTNN